ITTTITYCSTDTRTLHSFPTRRSSDLSITETNADFTANFAVTLDQAVQGGFDVAISASNGTAGSSDYTLNTTTLHFAGTVGESQDRKSTRLNSSHVEISYAVFCLKNKI